MLRVRQCRPLGRDQRPKAATPGCDEHPGVKLALSFEREKGFEPSTSTLARRRQLNNLGRFKELKVQAGAFRCMTMV
jgi:hypothetical protein